jgi:hypothetical protein
MSEGEAEERERRRRINAEATQPFFVPGFEGHWSGVVLFCATLVGLSMLWSCLPAARATLSGDAGSQATATFFVLYAAMAIGPVVGWMLWGARRRWAAMAVTAIFGLCVAWISPMAAL